MTLRHAITLAGLLVATLISAWATGELMDSLSPSSTLVGFGIIAGTFATCGFLAAFGKLLEEGTL